MNRYFQNILKPSKTPRIKLYTYIYIYYIYIHIIYYYHIIRYIYSSICEPTYQSHHGAQTLFAASSFPGKVVTWRMLRASARIPGTSTSSFSACRATRSAWMRPLGSCRSSWTPNGPTLRRRSWSPPPVWTPGCVMSTRSKACVFFWTVGSIFFFSDMILKYDPPMKQSRGLLIQGWHDFAHPFLF